MDEHHKNNLTSEKVAVRILAAFVIFSLITHYIAPYPSSHLNPEDNIDVFIYYITGYTISFFAVYFLVLIALFIFAYNSIKNGKRTKQNVLNQALIIALILHAIFLYFRWYGLQATKEYGANEFSEIFDTDEQNNEMSPVIIAVSAQDSQGITENDFDVEILKKIESWILETTKNKARQRFTELGYDHDSFNPEYRSSSVINIVDNKKLGIVKINMDSAARSVTIMGFVDKVFYRVACIRESNHDIPVYRGKCGNKIKEVFGVTLKSNENL